MKKKLNEGLFDSTRRFSDEFFDGLKSNATNKALAAAKKNKSLPPKIIQKLVQLDDAANELDKMLKELQ